MSHHRPFGDFTPLDQPHPPSHYQHDATGPNTNLGRKNSGKGPVQSNLARKNSNAGSNPPSLSRKNSTGSGSGAFTPAFPSDAGLMSSSNIHHPIPSRQPSAFGTASASRRGSFANPQPDLQGLQSLSRRSSMNYAARPDFSRRNSLAGGPRPITKAEYSGPNTPSILSRAGSPVLPLANEHTLSREASREGGFALHRKELRQGEFIGSLDCGTTYVELYTVSKTKADILGRPGSLFSTKKPRSSRNTKLNSSRSYLMLDGTNKIHLISSELCVNV